MQKKKKLYVVCNGRRKGIYDEWWKCKSQVDGYKGSRYRGFDDPREAITCCMEEMTDFYHDDDVYQVCLGKSCYNIPDHDQFLAILENRLIVK